MKKQRRGLNRYNVLIELVSHTIETDQLSCLPYKEFSRAFTEASVQGLTNKSSVWHNNIHVPVPAASNFSIVQTVS